MIIAMYMLLWKEKIVHGTVGNNHITEKSVVFKNNAPFRSCMSKMNNTFIYNTEDLDIIMPIYNVLEYNNNYSLTSESLWNYHRHFTSK